MKYLINRYMYRRTCRPILHSLMWPLFIVLMVLTVSCKKDGSGESPSGSSKGSLQVMVTSADLGGLTGAKVSIGQLKSTDTTWISTKDTDIEGRALFNELEIGKYVIKLPKEYVPLFAPVAKSVTVKSGERSDLTIQVKYTGMGNIKVDSTFVMGSLYSASQERDRLGQWFMASDFIPVGFYLPPNVPMKVMVKPISGNFLPMILVGTHARYDKHHTPREFPLTSGENIISDAYGGLLYIRYAGIPDVNKAEVSFRSGMRPAPFFQLGKTNKRAWKEMLSVYHDIPDVQLYGGKGIIVASRNNALKYVDEDQEAILKTVNKVLDAEAAISGLDNSSPLHTRNPHNFLLTECDKDGVYMNATNYRTAYHSSVIDALLTVEGVTSWGPWHELGHQHQQASWLWSNLTEVTVNIYSLAVQRAMGITPSRLVTHNNWESVRNYLNSPQQDKDFLKIVDDEGNWVKLGMFEQLRLAYGDMYYQQLHKRTREEHPEVGDDKSKMRYFMLTSCKVTGRDLTDFFKKWGFMVDDSVYSEIGALNLPKPSQDLTQLSE